jgi:hypothetical protein
MAIAVSTNNLIHVYTFTVLVKNCSTSPSQLAIDANNALRRDGMHSSMLLFTFI